MEADQVIKLFDSFWFRRQIIANSPSSPPPPTPKLEIPEESPKPALSRAQSRHTRSLSDQISTPRTWNLEPNSPVSLSASPKLEPIPSGRETYDIEDIKERKVKKQRRNRGRGRSSKSLSELEFEELKGFMDLGFVFSEEDRNSSLASIIPGLQRLGKEGEEVEEEVEEVMVSRRPYLSEAWEVMEERREMGKKVVMNWRLPSMSNEVDMKDSLRSWAHNVASGVR